MNACRVDDGIIMAPISGDIRDETENILANGCIGDPIGTLFETYTGRILVAIVC